MKEIVQPSPSESVICNVCPRNCKAERNDKEGKGFCRMPLNPVLARAGLHIWEEPCIGGEKGAGAVFFSGCALKCCYCQNYEISNENKGKEISTDRLADIFKELEEDLGIPRPPKNNGYLVPWAEQGVLLLNTVLTVRAHAANSHQNKGWETFTDRVIELLNEREQPMVFILWGGKAKAKSALITNSRHLVLTGAHPSPLSAYNGFFGGRYFSRTNEFLSEQGEGEIDWEIR